MARADPVAGALLDWAIGYGILGGYVPKAGAEIITNEGISMKVWYWRTPVD